MTARSRSDAPNLGRDSLVERLPSADLREIANIVDYWLKWVTRDRDAEGLETTADTHIMLSGENVPPVWPSASQLKAWIGAFEKAASLLEEQGRVIELAHATLTSYRDLANAGIVAGPKLADQALSVIDAALASSGDEKP